jgi:hypothetical protein
MLSDRGRDQAFFRAALVLSRRGFRMPTRGKGFVLLGAAIVTSLAAAGAAASNCIFQANEAGHYYVLGSMVQPQSSILAVGDCGATFEQIDAAYARNAQARRSASAEGARVTTADGCVYDTSNQNDCPTDSP